MPRSMTIQEVEKIGTSIYLRNSGCTVIVIPHDIDAQAMTIVDGTGRQFTYNSIELMNAMRAAERIRLDNAFKKAQSALTGRRILPEEGVGNESEEGKV